MSDAKEETKKRLSIAAEFNRKMQGTTLGIILVGSVAYSPNENVTEKSDLDLLVVYENLNDCVDLYFKDPKEREHLKSEKYDGFQVKRKIDGVDVSIHNLSISALEKIARASFEDLYFYRQSAKDIVYYSKDFDGDRHPFRVKSVPIAGLMGVKRIDPVAFEKNSNFVLGNDIDKIMSAGMLLHDEDGRVNTCIEDLWDNMACRMIEHYKNREKVLDIETVDMAPLLHRHERFSQPVKNSLKEKTKNSVRKFIK